MAEATAGHPESMEVDELESFLNSDPQEFKHAIDSARHTTTIKALDRASPVMNAPRAPRAMVANGDAPPTRKFKTPSAEFSGYRSQQYYLLAQEAWAVDGADLHTYWAADGQLNNMGDHYDRRPRYGGGGGGYRGGGRRKRRFDEIDEDHGNDRRPPPRPYHERENPIQRVRRHITTIADSPMRDAKEDVAAIAIQLADKAEDERFTQTMQDVLVQLVAEQPLKIPHVAGMILNLNQKNTDLVKSLLPKYTERAQTALDAGDWRTLKLILRLFACIHGLFETNSIFDVLEELMNRVVDLQTASSDDATGLEISKVILLTIPFVLSAPCIDPSLQKKAADILDKTEIIASAPPAAEDMVNPYVSIEGEEIPQQQPVLRLLQNQLRREEEGGWTLSFIPKFFDDPSAGDLMDGISNLPKHEFPEFKVPEKIEAGLRPLFPEVYFSLYADQDIETVPPTSHLASSVFRDVLVDTVNGLDFNREASAKYLIEMDCYWPPNLFAKRATPFDRLKDAESGQPTWKTEDLAVDAVFSQLLKLPYAEHKLVYYHTIITATCTIAPAAIAPSLGRAIRFLYRGLNVMDLELSYRFMDWFAHHLSNFDFRWKWPEWADDIDLSPLHCRKAFIIGTLDKEVRLSFAPRIRDSLPENFRDLIPRGQDNDVPDFKYNDATHPYHTEAKELVGIVRKKGSEEDITAILDRIIQSAREQSTHPNPQLLAIDAFVTTICYIGSKSLSHALSFIERHRERLNSFSLDAATTVPEDNTTPLDPDVAANAARIQIVHSVVDYWFETHTGVATALVDKLLNYGVILPSSVIDFALGVSNPSAFSPPATLPQSWRYEMVSATLGKVTGRVTSLVQARAHPSIPRPAAAEAEDAFRIESAAMSTLFAMVADIVEPISTGSNDRLVEMGVGDIVGEAPDQREERFRALGALSRMWGKKWARVFKRKEGAQAKVMSEGVARWREPVDVVEVETNGVDVNGGEDAVEMEADVDGV